MQNIVGIVRGEDKISSFKDLIAATDFDAVLHRANEESGKEKSDFKIVIKPNMMVFISREKHEALVTDKDLVENLIDHIRRLGFSNICVCEAQNDVGRMLKNHNVAFVADQIGYKPDGRYKIVDLTNQSVPFKYVYKDKKGKTKEWKDTVGTTWRDADFRITFAKCKTHEHDWMTLGVKNIYGCFPNPNKVCRYHIKNEVPDVTARALHNFPVHFSFVDGWIGSDGFQGYKIANPQDLKMLFGGNNPVAVDMEIFKRAGLNPAKSMILAAAVDQLYDGSYPSYIVKGDRETRFDQLCPWENVSDDTVSAIDILEEIYIAWGIINLKPVGVVIDDDLFPPKNLLYRISIWFMKKLYAIFKLIPWYRNLYKRKKKTKNTGDGPEINDPDKTQPVDDFAEDFSDPDVKYRSFYNAFINTLKIVRSFCIERPGQIIGSAVILIMIWGFHGELKWLSYILPGWKDGGPSSPVNTRSDIIPGLPWDHELISWCLGAFLLVIIPIIIIKFGYKKPLSYFGLGLPPKNRKSLAVKSCIVLTLACAPIFYLGCSSPEMQATYPLYRGHLTWVQFIIYQLTYIPFFLTIEFIFRGYLLFGLARMRDDDVEKAGGGYPGQFYFHKYALLIQMLSYTAWHLGKPLPELSGTLVWGLVAGALAYYSRSIWPVVIAHWLLNVFMDLVIWKGLYLRM
jgi:membrane protease YdiL (CAAX protease family)/uncharacterized protein (DUF362 family)